MRVEPSAADYSTLSLTDQAAGFTFTTLTLSNQNGKNVAQFSLAGLTGLTQYRSYFIGANGSTSGYLGLSAEL
jgi:hypothetical protein